jgi:hypothetical protein
MMRFYKIMFWFYRILYHILPVGFVLLLGWIMTGRVNPAYLNTVYFGCIIIVILTFVCKMMAEDIGRKKKLLRLKGES